MAKVVCGIDVLLREPGRLRGRNIGLVTNPTGITRDLRSSVDALVSIKNARVVALFGPEHGARGEVQDGLKIGSSADAATGLPVFSLYGEHKRPTPDMLAGIDLLVYDIQDVGCRFYTYPYTLSYVMEAAAEAGIEVMVLDRPNPIGGVTVEGPSLADGFSSFVGRYPIPVRHGLTIGEFARFINAEFAIGCKLSVVAMRGWQREMWFDATGLPWVAPSPNMPTLDTVAVYPGTCLFEGTNMSEGRGTTKPFEWIGAPWADGRAWADELNARALPGVGFRAVRFEPTFSKHAGQPCEGVQVHVTARQKLRAFELGLHMIDACLKLFARDFDFLKTSWEGRPSHFDLLSGDAAIRRSLLRREPVGDIAKRWRGDPRDFKRARAKHLLYESAQ